MNRLRRSDGEQTYAAILETAVRLASIEGLSSLTIGRLAEEAGVSKSGLYAHFGSKQQLELDIIQAARDIFEREVIQPALAAEEGLPRLEQICASYLSYIERRVFPGGCFFAGMLAEFDARSGTAAHDAVASDQQGWTELLESFAAEARDLGQLKRATDVPQLVFDLTAAVELANYYHVLFGDPKVLDRARTSIDAAIATNRS
ncbi:TetR/AcrR family transcriptional regulator [Kribbella sp. NPDC050124]|uniref:TetR/AcrR family transcriptional regulator n=1 Tax=Kribbella sp. NPDC050124 TaxID=3364114 RepID=UPI0037977F73